MSGRSNGIFILSLALSALAVCTSSSRAGLLVNGSFESSAPGLNITSTPGWAIPVGNIDVLNLPSGNDQPAPGQGVRFIDLVGTCPRVGAIEQSFVTEVGQTYELSGWVSHHPALGLGQADITLNGDFFAQLRHTGFVTQANQQWRAFRHLFVATGSVTTLRITDTTNLYDCGGLYLDGLDVSAVPEPGSLVLLGAGAGLTGLVTLARRRKVKLS